MQYYRILWDNGDVVSVEDLTTEALNHMLDCIRRGVVGRDSAETATIDDLREQIEIELLGRSLL